MDQIQALSITKNHWAIDNEFSFMDLKTNNLVNNAVENMKQQINFNKNLEDTVVEQNDLCNDETIVVKKDKLHIDLGYLENRYDVFNKKTYTKNTKTWKGVVLSIDKNNFTAKLFDLNDEGTYEIAKFDTNTDITEEDKSLLNCGAIFYWSIGNIIRNGTQTKQSLIRFRRLAALSAEEFNVVFDNIETDYGNINWI